MKHVLIWLAGVIALACAACGATVRASPVAISPDAPDGPVPAGTYRLNPFKPDWNGCQWENDAPPSGCEQQPEALDIDFTVAVPTGWAVYLGGIGVAPDDGYEGPTGVGITFSRGGWLHDDPCRPRPHSVPAIIVGSSVTDFVAALTAHPKLNVSAPSDFEFGGYAGKYIELTVPSAITQCADYRPWEPNLPAFGPDAVWELRVLDVAGMRTVVQSWYYPATSEASKAELHSVVDSIQIEP